jgi:hypothetical protein
MLEDDFDEGLSHRERMMREVQSRRTPAERKKLLAEAVASYRERLKSGELDDYNSR